mgnify:CR=1 FL=1
MLVHLPKGKNRLVYDPALLHVKHKLVALARTLADPGKNRVSAVSDGNVVDHLHDKNRLSDSGSAEKTDLSALCVRGKKVNDLYPRLKYVAHRSLVAERRRLAVYRKPFVG